MYRTDKQFMKNPATASSRIYVGNLAESVVAQDLEEKFQVHGKILGLVLQRGFGFIQFEDESQVHSAIKNEHGSIFHGRKMNVKQAFDNKNKGPVSTPAPASNVDTGAELTKLENCNPPPPETLNQSEANAPAILSKQQPEESHNDGSPPDKRIKRSRRNSRSRERERIPPMDNYRNAPSYYPREDAYVPSFVPPPLMERTERNDCEIIVVSKALTEYAEYIEQKLKSLGLVVDLLFPNEDVPIGRVLANISSRGCLYAIMVMPQNEEHRSLTLNVLHGIPQEHRNMPIEDALIQITRDFDAYMRGDKSVSTMPGNMSLSDRHPEPVQMCLNLLAENRQLTTAQYDRLLKYLQERRELQSDHEISEGFETSTEEPSNKQAELQSRIMNILNKSADSPKPVAAPVNPPPSSSGPTPLLNDPTVQKALDSLLLGDMFKSISAGF